MSTVTICYVLERINDENVDVNIMASLILALIFSIKKIEEHQ